MLLVPLVESTCCGLRRVPPTGGSNRVVVKAKGHVTKCKRGALTKIAEFGPASKKRWVVAVRSVSQRLHLAGLFAVCVFCNAVASGNGLALSWKCSGSIRDGAVKVETWTGSFEVDTGAGRWSGKAVREKVSSGETMDLELQGSVLDGFRFVGSDGNGVELEVFVTLLGGEGGTGIAGTLTAPDGQFLVSGKCGLDVDSTTGAMGPFSGELPPEQAWPERYQTVDPAGDLDPVKNPREVFCSLRGTAAEEVGSLGLLTAIEANCPKDRLVLGAALRPGFGIPLRGGAAEGSCVGDCEGDGQVTVDEVQRGLLVALGQEDLSACSAVDGNADGEVTIEELVRSVRNVLLGCGQTAGD